MAKNHTVLPRVRQYSVFFFSAENPGDKPSELAGSLGRCKKITENRSKICENFLMFACFFLYKKKLSSIA